MLRLRWLTLAVIAAAVALTGAAFAADDYEARIAALEKSGEVEAACSLAREWAEADADNVQALTTAADLEARCGDYDAAASTYEAACFFAPSADLYAHMGDAYSAMGDETSATRAYRKAFSLEPDCISAHVGMGRLYAQTPDHLMEAELCFQTALGIDPDNVDAQIGGALVALTDGNRPEALRRLLEVLDAHPNAAEAWLLAGKIAAEDGDTATAAERWRRFAALEPGRPEAWLLQRRMYPLQERPLSIRGSGFRCAPNANRIAYFGAGAVANQQLIICDLDGQSDPVPICDLGGTPFSLAWSPDGSRIAVGLHRAPATINGKTSEYRSVIITVSAQGGDKTEVYAGTAQVYPSWLPDGKHLCFPASPGRGGRSLCVAEDQPNATLTRLFDVDRTIYPQYVTWSPRGDIAVGTAYMARAEQPWALVWWKTDDYTHPHVLLSSSASLSLPIVAPDGNTVLFLQRDGTASYDVMALPVAEGLQTPRLLFRGCSFMPPSITPDGSQLLVYERAGLYLVNLGGLGQ
jgi:tetratricopeptide (TPR) repeat protein